MKKMVRAVAKQVLHQQLEDKYNTRNITPAAVPQSKPGDINPTTLEGVLPLVYQGDDSWERIGDRVRPKRLRVDITVTSNGILPEAWLGTVRFLILEDKSNKNEQDIPAVTGPRILQLLDNGPNQFGFTGRNQDVNYRINTRLFKVHCDKKLILSKSFGSRLASGSPAVAVSGLGTTVSYRFSVVVPTPATLVYQGPSYGTPTNFAPFACIGYAFNDSNYAADPAELPNARITWNMLSHFDYEDA